MRPDMFKVLIERPRAGAGWKKEGRPVRHEDSPRRQAMSRGRGSKHFSDLLGPLRRFLRSRVGLPWNQIHSEIRAQLSPSSTLQRHLLVHLDCMVEQQPVFVEGQACRGFGRGAFWPLYHRDFHLCPETGVLLANEKVGKPGSRKASDQAKQARKRQPEKNRLPRSRRR